MLAASCGMGLYYFSGEPLDEEEPLEHFQNGDYAEALVALEKNKRLYTKADYLLQKSYILRKTGDEQEADLILLKIVQSSAASSSQLSEVYLNLMLSAYLQNNLDLLKKQLMETRRFLGGHCEWVSLFMGVVFYHDGENRKALQAFASSSSRGYQSPWMEQRFSKKIDTIWYAEHLIDCLIKTGSLDEARAMLEKMKPVFFPLQMDEFNGLYGKSYLVEAEAMSYDLAIPHYRMAVGYLSRIQKKEKKVELAESLNKQIRQILAAEDFEYLPFYVQLYEQWGESKEVGELKDLLIAALDQQFMKGDQEEIGHLAETLAYLLKDSRVREEIGVRFENLLEIAIKREETELLAAYWNMLLAFQREDERVHGKFSDLAIQKVLQSIFCDDSSLAKTGAFINFYMIAEDKDEDSRQLADHLVRIAERYWEIPQQRGKSIELLKAAKKVAPHDYKGKVQASIEEMFKFRYADALKQDMLPELFDLMNAVETLEIASIDVKNRQGLQQQLEEAEYLYLQGQLNEAQNKAEWVLAIDPESVRARRLVGMVSYYFADYEKANGYLKDIPPVNDEMREAHAVVAILSGNEQKGRQWLEEVAKTRAVQPQIYLRIVYGFLVQDKPTQAVEWLEKVDEKNPEVLPARVFASFQLNSWYETIELFNQMKPPYVNLDGFHGIVVDSYTALGNTQQAEVQLGQLLKKPPQPVDSNFSPYFQAFIRKKLNQWNRFFVAGLYFKIVRNDPENALRYFDKIDNPSLLAQVEKAEVYFQLGRLIEAKDLMLQIDSEAAENQKGIKLRILPLLGMGFERLGYDIESVPFYEEYFKLKPNDADYRYPYIRVLMQLKRYDLALEQIMKLKKIRELVPKEVVAWMQSLLHRGDFEKVDKIANEWLSNRQVPLFPKLQMARMMVVTGNLPLLEYIVKEIPEPSQRSIEDNQELILLWMDMGEFAKALDLAQLLEKKLVQTPGGLLTLAELYMKLAKKDDAFSYAQRALQMDPANVKVLEFLERREQQAGSIAPLVKLLKDRVEQNPGNITLQIEYAKKLIDLAVEIYIAGAIANINDSVDLQQARLILEKLKGKEIELPEVHHLLGKVYYLVDLYDKAREEFDRALFFDPSYIEVLQLLALVYEAEKKMDKAIESVAAASRFAPSDSDVWEQLGNLYVEKQDWKSAVDAYHHSIRFSPFDPDPYLRLAATYLTVSQPVDAVKTLEGLLAFSPQNAAGLSLILKALYHPVYVKKNKDAELLRRIRIDYYDRLRIIDPELAKKSLPEGVSLDP